jgi:uncharacterized protein (DUF362 family)
MIMVAKTLQGGRPMYDVAIMKYKEGLECLKKAVELVGGLQGFSGGSKVVIKPNLVQWREGTDFPKYGVLTTARLIEKLVVLLKEHGVGHISLVEGPANGTFRQIASGMGLNLLAKRYGVDLVDAFEGSFARVTAGDVTLSISKTVLDADHVIDMPVMKTHGEAMVSLGIKNLKGVLNVASRQRCHSADPSSDLNYHLVKLTEMLRPSLTIIDGIYTLERGPYYSGDAHRTDIIVASRDLISADKVGAAILGIPPQTVPYIALVAENKGRPHDLSDINILGDAVLAAVSRPHQWEMAWSKAGDMPILLDLFGVKGITWRKIDNTLCSNCANFLPSYIGAGFLFAKNRDKPFDDIEILSGKIRDPEGGHKHTLLVGQCQVKRNGRNPLINHSVEIGGCPPSEEDFFKTYKELGIDLPDTFKEQVQKIPGVFFLPKYAGKSEFQEDFFRIR